MSTPAFDFDALQQSVTSSLQHIGLLQTRIDRLLEARDDALRQVGHRAGAAYQTGAISMDRYADLLEQTREVVMAGDERTRSGWSLLWPSYKKAIARLHLRAAGMFDQNESWGWSGPAPLDLAPRPPDGQAVVYVLYQDAEPVYVGSTYKFAGRLRGHRGDKTFNRWIAYPCADREAAYQLEERLLAEHLPTLNRRRGR